MRGIRPPTVPAGTSRLRISLTLNVDDRTMSTALADALGDALRMSRALVVTGTDTGVGKTVFAAGARRGARRRILEAGPGRAR